MDVHLVVIKGNPRGRTLTFGPGEYLFGRGTECHVRPDSEWVSRQHCLMTVSGEKIHLKDLGSTNGTLINGHRLIGERDLVQGDTIQIGPLVLQLRLPTQEALLEAMKQTDVPTNEPTIADEDNVTAQIETVRLPSNPKSE